MWISRRLSHNAFGGQSKNEQIIVVVEDFEVRLQRVHGTMCP